MMVASMAGQKALTAGRLQSFTPFWKRPKGDGQMTGFIVSSSVSDRRRPRPALAVPRDHQPRLQYALWGLVLLRLSCRSPSSAAAFPS